MCDRISTVLTGDRVADKIASAHTNQHLVEPAEEQFLVFNALDTLALVQSHFYDGGRGNWYVQTPSPVLLRSIILSNGEIVPFEFVQEYDET